MAQHDYVIANGTGAAVRSDLNNALLAIVSQNSGATEPTTTYAYQWWADTTTGLLKIRNSANNGWITLRELDGTLTIEDGTVSAPGLAFRDDLNTGIWRPGTDQFAISTNGVERVEWGTSEVVFNDGGTNYDFRIEGDNNANLLFVDASADAVGIGTGSPASLLSVLKNAEGTALEALRLVNQSPNQRSTSSVYIGMYGSEETYERARILCGNPTDFDGNNGFLSFWTRNAGTLAERVRIDNAGRLGIGTATPQHLLDCASIGRFTGKINGAASGTGIEIGYDNDTTTGFIQSYNRASSTYVSTAVDGSDIQLKISGTEKARLDSSGRWLLGTSSSVESNALLQVVKASGTNVIQASSSLGNGESCRVGTLANSRAGVIGVYKHSGITNPCGYLFLSEEDAADAYYWTDNSGNFRVSNDGNNIGTTNGTVVGTQTSDERIKNILGPVEYALETIKQIEPVRYSLKSEPDVEKLGFVAQQVLPLIPQSVFDTKERIEGEPEDAPTKLGMEYVALIPVLVNAIKELSAEVDALKAQ